MERFELNVVAKEYSDQSKYYNNIRKALICGFFMQIAHKEGEKGNYLTVKDNQVCRYRLSLSCTPHAMDLRLFRSTLHAVWTRNRIGLCSMNLC
jgi:hypothetical protein